MRELIDKHDAIDALNKLGDDWYGNDEVKRGIHLSIGVVHDFANKTNIISRLRQCVVDDVDG